MSTPDLNPTAASLLGFLLEGPKTGWDLVEAIERSVGYFWNVTRSQVYRELKTLAAAELVALGPPGPRERVPYEITRAGRCAFAAFVAGDSSSETLRLPIVVKVFFGDQMPREVLARHLTAARADHAGMLAAYEALWSDPHGPTNLYQRKCLELGLAYERMMLAWLDGQPWRMATGSKPIGSRAKPKKRPAT